MPDRTDRSTEARTDDEVRMIARELSRRQIIKAGAGLGLLTFGGALVAACTTAGSSSALTAGQSAGATAAPSQSTVGGTAPVVFGFSHPFADVPVVASVKQLVQARALGYGWTVLLDETQAGDLQDQISTLETWITQKVTAINLFPTQPEAFAATAQRAIDAGIIWTTYATKMELGAGGVALPASLSGEVTGKATVDWINANAPDAEVLILAPVAVGSEILKRVEIPKQMIREQTNATIVAEQDAAEQAKGLQATEDTLQAHPNLSVVVALSDDGALGAAEAFRKAGKTDPTKVWIIGQDGAEDALVALQDPSSFFRASAALDIGKLCDETVDVTKRAIEKGWKPGDPQEYIDLAPTLLVNGDPNVDRFLSTYRG